jgi:hypothetical protein
MSNLMNLRTLVSLGLILIGVFFATLPDQWIETTFHFDPDSGNGSLEFLFFALPIAAGILGAADILVRSGLGTRILRKLRATGTQQH